MADHILERRVWLPRPRPEVFDFFADPAQSRARPARVGAAALARAAAAAPRRGRRARLPGRRRCRSRWRVIVREFDPPYRFVDVQLRGPFARWEHRHRFVEGPRHDEPGARPAPGGGPRRPTGFPAGALGPPRPRARRGRGSVRGLFDYRDRRLRELFGGGRRGPAIRPRPRAARCRGRTAAAARARSGGRCGRGCSPSRCACRA